MRLSRTEALIFSAKAARTFCYGALGVVFPLELARRGCDALGIGVAVTATLVSIAAVTYAMRPLSRRYGARVVLMGLALMAPAAAAAFSAGSGATALVLAAALGNLAVGTGEHGPFLTLEQVLLAREAGPGTLTRVFSAYNAVGYGAAAVGAAVVAHFGPSAGTLFAGFGACGVLQAALYRGLRQDAAVRPAAASVERPVPPLVRRIAALFALDSFAGGLILQSLILYWLHARFGLDQAQVAWVAFGTQLVTGVSYLAAPALSRRVGLVEAMVFSHLISNLLLLGVAAASSATAAVGFLLARHLLSQIDVPTRQAFLMTVVHDDDREAAASLTNMSRTLGQCASPALAGLLMGTASALPLSVGAFLKIGYDLALYRAARGVEAR